MGYRFTTSNVQRYKFIQVPTWQLVRLPFFCVQKLKTTTEKNLFFCEALDDALISGINSRFSSQLEDLELILASAFHPKFKLSWYRGDNPNSKRIVDQMTKLGNEKLVIERDLNNSSRRCEDNPETFFKNLRTSSKTNVGVQLFIN